MTAPPNIFENSMHAFAEKAFRRSTGKQLTEHPSYIDYIIYFLESLLKGKVKQLLVNLPGRHLKTFLCSICFPAFALGHDPTLKFIIVCYSEDLAEDIVRQIREIMTSKWYRAVFKTRVSADHSRKYDFAIVGGGRVRAMPVNSVTGKGGDVVIFDDPHNAAHWNNKTLKAKVIEAFELLVSRRDGGQLSRMLVVGHRIAEDDVSSHIIERGDFHHLRLPLFAPHELALHYGKKTLTLKKGEALRPDEYSQSEIISLQSNHRGAPFRWYYQQGMGDADTDATLDVQHFPLLPARKVGRHFPPDVPVILSVDTAQKTASKSRNVVQVFAIREGHYDLVDAFAEKCDFQTLVKKVVVFARRHRANIVIVEEAARGADLIDELRKRISSRIIPFTPKGSKDSRFRKFVPLLRTGKVRVRQAKAVEDAVDEIIAFPLGSYDDNVDTLTNFLTLVSTLRFEPHRPDSTGITPALATATRPLHTTPASGIAVARDRSIFSSQSMVEHFSNGLLDWELPPPRKPGQ